jgi:translation initiation factor eIF-2B subunit beta
MNPRAFNRAVSLSNLLDTPAMADGLTSSFSGILSAAADAVAAAAAGEGDSEGMKRQPSRKGRAPPQWSSKNNVIELLNELLDELDGIEQQIAQQAVEHIHANEVRRLTQ